MSASIQKQNRRQFIGILACSALATASGIAIGVGTVRLHASTCPPLVHGEKFSLFKFEGTSAINQVAMAEHVADMARGVIGAEAPAWKHFVEFMQTLDGLGWNTSYMAGSLTGARSNWKSIQDMVHWRIEPFYWRSIELDRDHPLLAVQAMTPLHWARAVLIHDAVVYEKLAAVYASDGSILAAA